MNQDNTNNASPAHGPTLLAAIGLKLDSKISAQFAKLESEHRRITDQMEKYNGTAAEAAFRLIQSRAEHDPSSANLKALAETSRADIAEKFQNSYAQIASVRAVQLKKAAPLVIQIRDTVLAALDAELVKLESDNRARFERLGVSYTVAEDGLVRAIQKFRAAVLGSLACEGTYRDPVSIVRLLGPIAK